MTATFYVFIIMGALLVPTTTAAEGNNSTKEQGAAQLTLTTGQDNKTSSNVSTTLPPIILGAVNGTKETPTHNTSSMTGPPVTSTNRTTEGNSSTEARPTATTRPVNITTSINATTKSSRTSSHATTKSSRTSSHGLMPTPAPNDHGKPSKQPPNPPAGKATPAATPQPQPQNRKKYIILIIFITVLICLVVAIILWYVKRKSRRSSLDLHTKSEDAHIPLTPVAINAHGSDSPKEMETFTAVKAAAPTETAAILDGEKDLHAPAAVNETAANQTAEKPDGEKAPTEADQMPKETSAEGQAPVAAVAKPSEMTIVDLNEPSISAKTSVETLDELANENNSNSKAQASVNGNDCMTEICLLD